MASGVKFCHGEGGGSLDSFLPNLRGTKREAEAELLPHQDTDQDEKDDDKMTRVLRNSASQHTAYPPMSSTAPRSPELDGKPTAYYMLFNAEEEGGETDGNGRAYKKHEKPQDLVKLKEFVGHRMSGDRDGTVELLVQRTEKKRVWQSEWHMHTHAKEILYEYWRAQGGRTNALFRKPKNPPPERYHVFKVLRHEKRRPSGFRFEVQWLGHDVTPGETSMETEAKLKNIAPKLLDKYWTSVGGRDIHLAKRGETRKTRVG